MRMYDLIMKKRNGEALTKEEIQYMITEYVDGKIPDYQMSAFLMTVYFKGMNQEETLAMTQAVAPVSYTHLDVYKRQNPRTALETVFLECRRGKRNS